jgi:hypothetical protein
MALKTFNLEIHLDLDNSGTFATDISGRVYRPKQKGHPGAIHISDQGQKGQLPVAAISKLTLLLDNEQGDFSPDNASSPYWDGARLENKVQPGRNIRLRTKHDGFLFDIIFQGVIETVVPAPHADQKTVVITARDFAARLERADVRLPLMRDVRTGLVIHRLLDLATKGEHIDNPRFRDNVSGYSALGAAGAPVRVTTGRLLHDPAVMDVALSGAVGDGWRYAIPHAADSEFQGVRVLVVTYVWTEDPVAAAAGNQVKVGLTDSVTLPSVGYGPPVTISTEPQPIGHIQTFDGAATDFYVQAVAHNAVSAYAFRTGAVHCATLGRAMERGSDADVVDAIDLGDTRLEQVAFDSGRALSYLQELAREEQGGLFFFEKGLATFHSKKHRWQKDSPSRVSQLTLTERGRLTPLKTTADRLSEVIIEYPRWEFTTELEPVFILFGSMPRQIPPNGTLTIEAEYFGTVVRDAQTPVANQDYIISDGSGADRSGDVTLDFEDFGGAGVAKFTDTSGDNLLLEQLEIRGKPVRRESDVSPIRVVPVTPPDLAADLRLLFRLNSNAASMQPWGQYLANFFGDKQRQRLGVEVAAPWPVADDVLTEILPIIERNVGDRITVTQKQQAFSTGYDARDFYIDSITRRFGGGNMTAVWKCSEVDNDYWTLGTSKLGSETRLAP